jgi:hypothetical protein
MIVVFDIDGCISDDRHRLHLKPNWDSYHALAHLDPPMNLDRLTHGVVFITARPEKYRKATEAWLNKHLDIKWELLMRPEGNSMTSPDLKLWLLTGRTSPWGVIKAYDDREDVLEAYQALGIKTELLTYPDDSIFAEMEATFQQRQQQYGPSYLRFGDIAKGLWPDGLTLHTKEDFIRHGILVQCISKLVRYAHTPAGHRDSAHDLAVYAALLTEQTNEEA